MRKERTFSDAWSQMHNVKYTMADTHFQLHSQMHICICIHKCINSGHMNTFIVKFTVKFLTSHHTGRSGNKQDTWTYSTSTSQWSSMSTAYTDAQIWLQSQMHKVSCIHRCTDLTAISDAQSQLHSQMHKTSCIIRCTCQVQSSRVEVIKVNNKSSYRWSWNDTSTIYEVVTKNVESL
jgi:hypothetical protein